MKIVKYIAIILLFCFFFSAKANESSNVVFIDIDFLIQESQSGKETLKRIDDNNKKKTIFFKKKEEGLKKRENDIKKKNKI